MKQKRYTDGGDDEARLTAGDRRSATGHIIELAKRYGRYGYRRITALLRDAGWTVNRKRVERIWRREGLKVPQRQPRRSCPIAWCRSAMILGGLGHRVRRARPRA
jgi:transposase InsO family protein